jgi:hypothetical protein
MLMLLLVGCGPSGADRVASAYKERLAAATARDYYRYCERTSAEQRRELTGQGAGLSVCADVMRRRESERVITEYQREAVERVEVVDVRIDGDRATAFLPLEGCTSWGSSFRRPAWGGGTTTVRCQWATYRHAWRSSADNRGMLIAINLSDHSPLEADLLLAPD